MKAKLYLALFFALFSTSSYAEWKLNSDSTVTFVSIKADLIGEQHHFKKLSGGVSAAGDVDIAIDLSSVETNIPIRNERMLEFLFEVAQFPQATIASKIDPNKYQALPVGGVVSESLPLTLEVHGKSAELSANVLVFKASSKQLLVVTESPILVSAGTFDLTAGVDKLQSLAGLSSISKAVPVSFKLVFDL